MTTFFLIRHAQCDGVGHVLWGRTQDVHLNEDGVSAACLLAQRITQHRLDAIYSSPLERAVETAEKIARRSGIDTVNISESLNELDFGEWTGETVESLENDPVWRNFNTVRSDTPIPGGESIHDAQSRVVDELKQLSAKHENGNVAVVSHADVIKVALAYFVGLDVDKLDQIDIAPCSVTLLRLDGTHADARAVNL